MKKLYLLTFLLCSLIGLAQIPANYYTTATGTGLTLKTNLCIQKEVLFLLTNLISTICNVIS